ncbi:uncharacterized protein (DUF58 family) [Aurantimicrobium minutum]|uniref:DUF58 domain-containing protein n=1 Tax=Aurantimicrobium minutum TaxID=708131 RepID=UPI00247713CB|nr:DUF58 domain-containing protein [Aurantimicrobium minutum]MDH6532615.1 uncharacterized protein (DUF58 family) [Aurantimicrobium minutum]
MIFRVVTSRGWGWAIIALLCLVVGAVLGWIELIGLGIAGLVTFGVATLYALFRHAHEVSFRLAHHRVVVGEDAEVLVSVENPTPHSLLPLDVIVPVGEQQVETHVGRLRKGAREDITVPVPTGHRGMVAVGPARVVRQDPLGLISREVVHGDPQTLYIHPKTIGLLSMSSGFVRDLEGNPTRDLTDSDLSFHALREYVPGDDRRNIHWKSTAKTGQFMVRQFEQTRRSHLMIALDTEPEVFSGDDEFELAVSVAASVAVRAIRDTRELSVLVSADAQVVSSGRMSALREAARELATRRRAERGTATAKIRALSTISRERLLDELSGVHLQPGSPNIVELSRLASVQAGDVSIVFLVTAGSVDSKTLHSASVAFPAGVEVVVLCCAPEASPVTRRMGRLTVATIGRLDDVQQLLGKRMVTA